MFGGVGKPPGGTGMGDVAVRTGAIAPLGFSNFFLIAFTEPVCTMEGRCISMGNSVEAIGCGKYVIGISVEDEAGVGATFCRNCSCTDFPVWRA